MKFDKQLSSIAAELLVKFHCNIIIQILNLSTPLVCNISW